MPRRCWNDLNGRQRRRTSNWSSSCEVFSHSNAHEQCSYYTGIANQANCAIKLNAKRQKVVPIVGFQRNWLIGQHIVGISMSQSAPIQLNPFAPHAVHRTTHLHLARSHWIIILFYQFFVWNLHLLVILACFLFAVTRPGVNYVAGVRDVRASSCWYIPNPVSCD